MPFKCEKCKTETTVLLQIEGKKLCRKCADETKHATLPPQPEVPQSYITATSVPKTDSVTAPPKQIKAKRRKK